jgi:hypothetical protein
VDILPDERVQMNALSSWLIQKPREWDSHYETCIANDWPHWRVKAHEVEDSILCCAGIGRKGGDPIVEEQEKEDRANADNGGGKGCAADRYCPKETRDEYESRHGDPPEDVIAAAHFCEELQTQSKCAAGNACKAHPGADLAASSHHCVGCCFKVHSAVLCGATLDEVVVNYPHLVGRQLSGGRVIAKGADDNEIRCLCFSCIEYMSKTTVPVGISLVAAEKENIIAHPNSSSNPIEKCSWDDIVVTTTHTIIVVDGVEK